jgi:uncharacterized protein
MSASPRYVFHHLRTNNPDHMTPLRTAHIAALLLLTFTVQAQTAADPTAQEPPYIEVTGRSEMKVVPDQIHIAIELKERGSGDKKVTVEKQELDLKQTVQGLGIDAANLTLSDAIADYVPKKFRKDDVVETKTYELKVADAEMVRKVFRELDRLEIENARIDRVSHSKEIEFRKEQRIKAIQAAKEKADYLLGAIDEKAGSALIIIEEVPETSQGREWRQARGQLIQGSQSLFGLVGTSEYEAMGVTFSRITISAGVYVKFRIVPR